MHVHNITTFEGVKWVLERQRQAPLLKALDGYLGGGGGVGKRDGMSVLQVHVHPERHKDIYNSVVHIRLYITGSYKAFTEARGHCWHMHGRAV